MEIVIEMTKKEDIPGFDAKTIEWQCSGCNHLCKVLTDRFIKPNDTIRCNKGTVNFKIC